MMEMTSIPADNAMIMATLNFALSALITVVACFG
jgi:hypothetical protein